MKKKKTAINLILLPLEFSSLLENLPSGIDFFFYAIFPRHSPTDLNIYTKMRVRKSERIQGELLHFFRTVTNGIFYGSLYSKMEFAMQIDWGREESQR
jgi:hypothetical protein